MTDQELADKIVALGIGEKTGTTGPQGDGLFIDAALFEMFPAEFVRDWRVTGSMMEKCLDAGFVFDIGQKVRILSTEIAVPIDDSLPRAINEACAEALT